MAFGLKLVLVSIHERRCFFRQRAGCSCLLAVL